MNNKNFISFTLLRLWRNGTIVLSVLITILISIASELLNYAFYKDAGTQTQNLALLGAFQGYTQLSFLIFSFVFTRAICFDIEQGIAPFIKQIGVSQIRQGLVKIISLVAVVFVSEVICYITLFFVFRHSTMQFLLICILFSFLSIMFIALISFLSSMVFRKMLPAVFSVYGYYVIANLLNFFFFGLFNQADSNGYVTFALQKSVGQTPNNVSLVEKFFNTSFAQDITNVSILYIVYFFLITLTLYVFWEREKNV